MARAGYLLLCVLGAGLGAVLAGAYLAGYLVMAAVWWEQGRGR